MCSVYVCYLVKEKNEVDSKAHKESQEAQVVEVASQVVLEGKRLDCHGEQTEKLTKIIDV